MTDYDDLCKELRDPQSHSEPRLWRARDAAATAIDALREQVAEKDSLLQFATADCIKAEADNAAKEKENAELRREILALRR